MLTRTENQIGTLYNPNPMRVTVSSKTHYYQEFKKLRSGTLHISVSDLLPQAAGEAWFKEAFEIRANPGSIIVHNIDTARTVEFSYWSPAMQQPHSGSKHYNQLLFTNRGSFRNGIVEVKLVVWELQDELRNWIDWYENSPPPHKVRENVIYTHSK